MCNMNHKMQIMQERSEYDLMTNLKLLKVYATNEFNTVGKVTV